MRGKAGAEASRAKLPRTVALDQGKVGKINRVINANLLQCIMKFVSEPGVRFVRVFSREQAGRGQIIRRPGGFKSKSSSNKTSFNTMNATPNARQIKPLFRRVGDSGPQAASGKISPGPDARFEFTSTPTRNGGRITPGAVAFISTAAPCPASPSHSGQSAGSSTTGSR